MPKRSLEKWLHPTPNESGRDNNTTTLSIVERLSIAIDVATALEYLHHQCQTPIVHCNLEPSNVLLDKYVVGGEVSMEVDVYSFGILLLEIFTGKRPTRPMLGDNFSLREFIQASLPHELNQVLDPVLCMRELQGNLYECLDSVLRVGLMCSNMQPKERMDIGEAAISLRKAKAVLRIGTRRNRV
ncbi:probable LRR receptor-like serine/threonine-protein kinase At3g47570 [Punica granatum]|uniref:Uncharacterized protein n=2 Tax=Punica granatum TaxID=22663 RepID=A0A2I0K1V7_PUNGR|nr:probable LRR receptor-like serine/threonine-protein kinase At3g47570 [Punica granatum]PKI62110.1 hypothetical protein CRG98_017483 [Punica granatum]